jgi:hypothetical protein
MSSVTHLTDAELDAVTGGFGFSFTVNKNVAQVQQQASNLSLLSFKSPQYNSQQVAISQSNYS